MNVQNFRLWMTGVVLRFAIDNRGILINNKIYYIEIDIIINKNDYY
jgi:hypothetical protein